MGFRNLDSNLLLVEFDMRPYPVYVDFRDRADRPPGFAYKGKPYGWPEGAAEDL